MDNFHIDVLSQSREALRAALRLVFEANGDDRCLVSHWVEGKGVPQEEYSDGAFPRGVLGYEENTPCLVLLWHHEEHGKYGPTHPMPTPLDLDGAVEMAWRWLQKQEVPGGEVHSGDVWVHLAFRLFNSKWGHVGPYRYGLCAIQPAQALIGK